MGTLHAFCVITVTWGEERSLDSRSKQIHVNDTVPFLGFNCKIPLSEKVGKRLQYHVYIYQSEGKVGETMKKQGAIVEQQHCELRFA